jgi:hypothetical protein
MAMRLGGDIIGKPFLHIAFELYFVFVINFAGLDILRRIKFPSRLSVFQVVFCFFHVQCPELACPVTMYTLKSRG